MAADQPIRVIDQNYPSYPILLAKRLGKDAPVRLWAIGRLDLINIPKSALFCSKRCPGDAILGAINKPKRPSFIAKADPLSLRAVGSTSRKPGWKPYGLAVGSGFFTSV